MAITKLLRIKEATGGDQGLRLKKNLNYICDPVKTENGKWLGGNAGMDAEDAYRRMKRNKVYFQKEMGSQAFHYILSFPPDEKIDAALAATITEEFCRELLADDYLYVYAIHTDKHHIHGHITFDSVSRTNGLKFHSPKGDWEKRIQPITDKLCRKHKLSTLDYQESNGGQKMSRTHSVWEQEQMERETGQNTKIYNWYDIIRDDVDEAIEASDSYETFLNYLKEHLGYLLRDTKHLSLHPPGKQRAVRVERLGAGYNKEEIRERIQGKKYAFDMDRRIRTYGDRQYIRRCIIVKMRSQKNRVWKLSPYQKAYYRKWNNTYFIRKPDRSNLNRKYREDILKVHRLAEQLNYIITFDIRDEITFHNRAEEVRAEKSAALAQYKSAKTRLFLQEPFSIVMQLEKIEAELGKYPEDCRMDLQAKRTSLLIELQEYGSVYECSRETKELKDMVDGYKDAIKSLNTEIQILKRIASENLDRPDLVFTDTERAQMKHYEDNRNRGTHKRITINEKLFHDVNEMNENAISRIPFHENEYLVIPLDDCKIIANGKVLSAYLYDEEEYRIVDLKGNEITKKKGKDVAGYYDIRNISPKHTKTLNQ